MKFLHCKRCGCAITCPFCPGPWCHEFSTGESLDEVETTHDLCMDNGCDVPLDEYEAFANWSHAMMEKYNIKQWPPPHRRGIQKTIRKYLRAGRIIDHGLGYLRRVAARGRARGGVLAHIHYLESERRDLENAVKGWREELAEIEAIPNLAQLYALEMPWRGEDNAA